MDLFIKLPSDIRNGLFRYFAHPAAEKITLYNSPRGRLMADLRDYPHSLKQLYKLPFAKNHDGKWGRASLLNYLWMYSPSISKRQGAKNDGQLRRARPYPSLGYLRHNHGPHTPLSSA